MLSTKNKYLFYVGLIVLLTHFFLILLHQIYPNKFTNYYLQPFFIQHYKMFVPPPDSQYHLYIFNDNKFVEDAFTNIVQKHQNNRLAGYEPLVLAMSNSIFYFEKNALQNQFYEGKIEANSDFLILEKMVINYYKSTQSLQLKNLKIILLVNKLNENKPRVYFN